MLGITIDNRPTFSSHIREFCKKASQKISALSRMSNQLKNSEKDFLFNIVVKSQFNYCPLYCKIIRTYAAIIETSKAL